MEKIIFLILTLILPSCQEVENSKETNLRNEDIQKFLADDGYEIGKIKGKVASISIYQYAGKIENEKIVKDSINRYPVDVAKYDKSGKKVEHITFWDDESTPHRKRIYIYDDDRLIESKVISYDKNGKKKEGAPNYKYTYSDDNVTVSWYKKNEILTKKVEMEFDEMGGKKSEFHQWFDGDYERQIKVKLFYNNKNLLKRKTEEWHFNDSKTHYETTFKYDEYGNVTEEKRVNQEGEINVTGHNIEYEYDDNGNWIRRIKVYKDGGQIIINERKIEYL